MKKNFFIFGAIISTFSACFAELVPGASHTLNFTDEEVEALQRLLWLKSPHHYESFFKAKIDPNTLKKYPPHNLIQPEQNFASYEIKNKEAILISINDFSHIFEDFTVLSNFHSYFIYMLLIIMFEKLEFPLYSSLLLDNLYYMVTLGIHKILQCWPDKLNNLRTFPEFRKNISSSIPVSIEADSIFIPIKTYEKDNNKCCIQ